MSNIRFWLDMDHRTPKRSDKLIIGNIDTGQTMYIDLAELLNALTTNDLAESTTRKYITPELLDKLENLSEANYTLTQLQQYFYPKSSNPEGYLTADSSLQAAKISGILAASKIPELDAAKIITGTFGASRIPSLPASKITSGQFDVDRIPTLPASKIEGFALDLANYILKTAIGAANGVTPLDANQLVPVGHIPNIDASKITSGVFNEDRFSSILVKVSQIIDNLFSEDDLAPLSANQGRVLKELIDEAAANTPTVIDNLVSTEVDSSLSANQGRVLMNLISGIQNILDSDDTALDEFQEIVNFIKANKEDLQNLSIPNIAGLVDALAAKEPAFSKNAAFNRNFGSASGTVAEGNDSRFQKAETAHSWGNHANAGYETEAGATSKANAAEQAAKNYSDDKTEEDIIGTATEADSTGTLNLNLSNFSDIYLTLTGNTTITVFNTPASGKAFVKTATIKSAASQSLELPASWTIVGEYVADGTENYFSIKFSNYATAGLKVICIITQQV